jgi:hypothetical protein
MFRRSYYCFIAGLPDLAFEDSKFKSSIQAFRQELELEISPGDYSLVRLLFLPHDHENLINYLLDRKVEHDPLGNFTPSDFEQQIIHSKSETKQKPLLPGYMAHFIMDFYDEEKENKEEAFEKILMEGYYNHVLQTNNPFLRQWFEFEVNAKNILTATICKKHQMDITQEIVGENELAQELIQAGKRNFEMTIDDDYLNEILQLSEIKDFYQRERGFDLLKWEYIDEHSFFYYFTVERLMAYLIKLFIVFRWIKLHKETGRKFFEKLIQDLGSSFELPEEFSLTK